MVNSKSDKKTRSRPVICTTKLRHVETATEKRLGSSLRLKPGWISVPVATTAEPPGKSHRDDLHRLVEQLPAGRVEAARKYLRRLIREGSQSNTVVSAATDVEVEAATEVFISHYREALERLAK